MAGAPAAPATSKPGGSRGRQGVVRNWVDGGEERASKAVGPGSGLHTRSYPLASPEQTDPGLLDSLLATLQNIIAKLKQAASLKHETVHAPRMYTEPLPGTATVTLSR